MLTAAFGVSILDDLRSIVVDIGSQPNATLWIRAATSVAYLAAAGAVAWRPRWMPLPFLVMLALTVTMTPSTTLPFFVCLLLAFAAYAVPISGLALMVAGAVCWDVVTVIPNDRVDARLLWWLPVLVLVLVPGWTARVLVDRAAQERAFAQRQEREAREREVAIVETTRLARERFSRELHDVVAHELTRIAMQSSMSQLSVDPMDHRAALEDISRSSRTAMSEMRRLVRILHERDDDAGDDAPGPGPGSMWLSDELDNAASYLRSVDIAACTRLQGEESRVPPGLRATGIAVLREATTNIVKHGRPAMACRLLVAVGEDDLVIEVRNEVCDALLAAPRSGLGLAGLRSRLSQVGTLHAAVDDGWWVLRAVLPLAEEV